MAREGVPLNVIQRQLGHANLGVTSIDLQGIDNAEIIETGHARHAPVLPASTALGSDAPFAWEVGASPWVAGVGERVVEFSVNRESAP